MPSSWLVERWKARFPEVPPLPQLLSEGRVVLLLDALNEMPLPSAAVLREAGLAVKDLVVLIERGDEGRRDMAEAGIALKAWARIEDLLEAGLKAGFLDEDMAARVRAFAREA